MKFCNWLRSGGLAGHPHFASKSFDGHVALSAIESPKNWFEDFGSAQLVNGVAVVALDPDFIQTVNTGMDYKSFRFQTASARAYT